MPASDFRNVPAVLHALVQCIPNCDPWSYGVKVLDVGCGFGKYGVLFRETLDIVPERYEKALWKSKIDAVEIWPRWITPLHRHVYNEIFIEDFSRMAETHKGYDVIFFGDVIEHFDKEAGLQALRELLKWNSFAILCVPDSAHQEVADSPQLGGAKSYLDNPYEAHRSRWYHKDFPKGTFYDTGGSACFVVRVPA